MAQISMIANGQKEKSPTSTRTCSVFLESSRECFSGAGTKKAQKTWLRHKLPGEKAKFVIPMGCFEIWQPENTPWRERERERERESRSNRATVST